MAPVNQGPIAPAVYAQFNGPAAPAPAPMAPVYNAYATAPAQPPSLEYQPAYPQPGQYN
ncbi:hypothetical protein KIPB_013349, partial [Kipferlia bialata]|eukprot:g13349.t1